MIFRFVLIVFSMLILSTTASLAQNAKIAVLDVEKVLNDSLAGKSIQAQLSSRREAFQKEFSSRENNLVSAERSLIEKKADMSADNFAAKRKEFETQLLETRNLFQKRRNALDKGLSAALADLRKNVIEVAAKVADEGKHEIVLTRNSVVIVQKEMDITEAVLARLNSKIQSIKLDVVQ